MTDLIHHAIGAVVIVLLVMLLPYMLGAPLANMAFWMAREWEQHPTRAWPWHWHKSKTLEWVVPTILGFVTWFIFFIG